MSEYNLSLMEVMGTAREGFDNMCLAAKKHKKEFG